MNRWVTDTHGLLWHLYNANKLSAQVKEIFVRADNGEHQIVIPAIVLVETVYLAERARIVADAIDNVLRLLQAGADNYVVAALDVGVALALTKIDASIVPDMPDRVIAATALHLDLPLLTRDGRIQMLGSVRTVW
ncbi:MAG: PIN domain-containing protein [Anaerolineales bacterium]|nr:PIN domain-containing protein [Anaerolineales bacterium]